MVRACWLAVVLLVVVPAFAWAGDETACQTAISGAARKQSTQHRVLGTIAIVESGRVIHNKIVPWPWSINVGGTGRSFASKEEAVAAVRTLLAAGTRSVDVGCMQINLAAHPQAFGTLEDAFDPAYNVAYAARFLQTLSAQTGRLATAMVAYHSQTPEFAADYARRLLSVWPGAATLGVSAELEVPTPPEPPSPYTPRMAGQLAESHVSLQTRLLISAKRTPPRSQIEIVSSHGASWPTMKQ